MKTKFIIIREIATTIISIIGAASVVLGSIGIYGYIIYFMGNMWVKWW